MAGRRVAFFGNCQADALATVYEQRFGGSTGDVVTYTPSYEQDYAARLALYDADIAVIQQFDFPSKIAADTKPGTHCVLFPSITAGFLWPHGGRGHPRNEPTPYCPTGPYPDQQGDAFLDKLMADGVGVDEAVARYLEADIVSTAEVDRLYELTMRRQRYRDDISGVETAPFIEANFRTTQILLTPSHLDLSLFSTLAGQVYTRLGLSDREVQGGLRHLRRTPFPREALPLHPQLIRHFGIQFADPATRYRFFEEGAGYTFEEYMRRYYGYVWNAPLSEGLWLAHSGDPAQALEVLTQGLAGNPDSLVGLCTRAALLSRLGRHAEAASDAQDAVELWPAEPEGYVALSDLMRACGDLDGAVREARQAVAACQNCAPAHVCLAMALEAAGDKQGAAAAAQTAAGIEPANRDYARLASAMLAHLGEHSAGQVAPPDASKPEVAGGKPVTGSASELPGGAQSPVQNAHNTPTATVHRDANLVRDLAAKAVADNELDKALVLSQELATLNAQDAHAHAAVGRCLALMDRHDEAETAYLTAARLEPGNADICRALADVVGLQGRGLEALGLALQATQTMPPRAVNFGYLGHQLIRNSFDAAAEPVLRWALQLDPATTFAAHALVDLLLRQTRPDDAQAVRSRFLEGGPGAVV